MTDQKNKEPSVALLSYPRSGSKWFRFLVCNAVYPLPLGDCHDFKTVEIYFPRDEVWTLARCHHNTRFIASHERVGSFPADKIVYLYRHVGDTLFSNYHFHQSSINYEGTIAEYLEEKEFGFEWRLHVQSYLDAVGWVCGVQYEKMNDFEYLGRRFDFMKIPRDRLEEAAKSSTFDKMVEADNGKREYMRRGTSNQWQELDAPIKEKLIAENKTQLEALGYL